MNKKKYNLVGNQFTHLTNGNRGYSVHGKVSKYIEWVKDGGDDTFYLETTIKRGITDKRDGFKYLWLMESKSIQPKIFESIINNRKLVEDNFEIIFTHDQRLLKLGKNINGFLLMDFGLRIQRFMTNQK